MTTPLRLCRNLARRTMSWRYNAGEICLRGASLRAGAGAYSGRGLGPILPKSLDSARRGFSASPSPPPTGTPSDLAPVSQIPQIDPTTWHAWVFDSIPVRSMQTLLEVTHEATGLPWWASIVLSTLAFRLALLPVVRYQAHALARLARAAPLVLALNRALSKRLDGVRAGDWAGTTAVCQDYAAGVRAALKLHQVSLLAAIASPIVQLPVFVTFALANRRMIDQQVPGLEEGGVAWFEDLTEADPLLILPVLCLGSTYLNLELGFARLHESQIILRFLKDNLQLFLILGAPVSSTLPAGVFIYWFTSSVYGHAQHFALRNPDVRLLLGFPTVPKERLQSGGAAKEGPASGHTVSTPAGSEADAGVFVEKRIFLKALQALDAYESRRKARLKQTKSDGEELKKQEGSRKEKSPELSIRPVSKSRN
ncbi:mitochondrial inner membrane protein oxa1l [Nannochloropsis gaditana]|uniref:Mitochondrial inner membrane protein oxa1l n=1 Tax=Nannochloropsis gaditana TaxID=72520 RepID=W7U431_9STRA|nr:mitochondrial inner membrane protein oxa1l [Nannochloropsis gaditana]